MSRLLLCAALLLAMPTLADQCEAMPAAAASRATAVLKPGLRYVALCEPCGEKTPGPVKTVKDVKVKDFDAELKELWLDGKSVDLAYTFVETEPSSGVFKNLARLADCAADGVSKELRLPAKR